MHKQKQKKKNKIRAPYYCQAFVYSLPTSRKLRKRNSHNVKTICVITLELERNRGCREGIYFQFPQNCFDNDADSPHSGKGNAFKLTNARGQLGHLERRVVDSLWPLDYVIH